MTKPNAADVAKQDQMLAGIRDLPKTVGAYYKGLRDQGVPAPAALELTRDCQGDLVEAVTGAGGDSDD